MISPRTLIISSVLAPALCAAPNFEAKLLAIDANEACALADFNNDGILDLSAGRNWYAGLPKIDCAQRPLTGKCKLAPTLGIHRAGFALPFQIK